MWLVKRRLTNLLHRRARLEMPAHCRHLQVLRMRRLQEPPRNQHQRQRRNQRRGAGPAGSLPLLAGRVIAREQETLRIRQPLSNLPAQRQRRCTPRTGITDLFWGFESITDRYAEVQSVQMESDGNFVVRGADDEHIWSALTENPTSAYTHPDRGRRAPTCLWRNRRGSIGPAMVRCLRRNIAIPQAS